jgi:hypothetical protein
MWLDGGLSVTFGLLEWLFRGNVIIRKAQKGGQGGGVHSCPPAAAEREHTRLSLSLSLSSAVSDARLRASHAREQRKTFECTAQPKLPASASKHDARG